MTSSLRRSQQIPTFSGFSSSPRTPSWWPPPPLAGASNGVLICSLAQLALISCRCCLAIRFSLPALMLTSFRTEGLASEHANDATKLTFGILTPSVTCESSKVASVTRELASCRLARCSCHNNRPITTILTAASMLSWPVGGVMVLVVFPSEGDAL